MATATTKYTSEAKEGAMKDSITAASDSTNLGSGIDVAVFVAKTATNKAAIINTLNAVIQKITEEAAT